MSGLRDDIKNARRRILIMYLSIDDIHKKYNGQWIFAINCDESELGETIGGDVVLHSERRDKVIHEMARYMDDTSRSLIFYAGKIPEGVSVVL
jgi:hypothetical protein